MSTWSLLRADAVEVPREGVSDYVRTQLGAGLRRAGISAEFTLTSARASWRQLTPEPIDPCLALIWTTRTFPCTETAAVLDDWMGGKSLPMPFQFIASQPHMVGVHAQRLFPGLAQVITLVGSGDGIEAALLPGLAHGHPWTHVLLGEVWTPQREAFRASWRVLRRS